MTNYKDFEFKNYIPTPNDQYMLGIAKVKLYGKIVVNFKHVKTKDGTGTFFCTNNYSITDALGEKKYIPCAMLDSRDDDEELHLFIRECVNRDLALRSSTKIQQNPNVVQYPNGTIQIRDQPPTSMSEVAADEQIPF